MHTCKHLEERDEIIRGWSPEPACSDLFAPSLPLIQAHHRLVSTLHCPLPTPFTSIAPCHTNPEMQKLVNGILLFGVITDTCFEGRRLVFTPTIHCCCSHILAPEMSTCKVEIFAPLYQSVTFVKILMRMNVRIYSYQQSYTKEYPNIFILIFLTQTNVRISIRNENCMNIRIYSNIRLGFTL